MVTWKQKQSGQVEATIVISRLTDVDDNVIVVIDTRRIIDNTLAAYDYIVIPYITLKEMVLNI